MNNINTNITITTTRIQNPQIIYDRSNATLCNMLDKCYTGRFIQTTYEIAKIMYYMLKDKINYDTKNCIWIYREDQTSEWGMYHHMYATAHFKHLVETDMRKMFYNRGQDVLSLYIKHYEKINYVFLCTNLFYMSNLLAENEKIHLSIMPHYIALCNHHNYNYD